MTPMTKEEYEKKQSEVRRVFDPDSGRNRFSDKLNMLFALEEFCYVHQ